MRFINYCDQSAINALRYLAKNPRPSYGQEMFNTEHLLQIASELERSVTPSESEPDVAVPKDEETVLYHYCGVRQTSAGPLYFHGSSERSPVLRTNEDYNDFKTRLAKTYEISREDFILISVSRL